MSKTMIRLSTLLLAVAITMTLAGVAEAGNLTSRKAPSLDQTGVSETGGVLIQALSWLTSFWTGATTRMLEKNGLATEEPATTAACTSAASQECDAGYGLDPNG